MGLGHAELAPYEPVREAGLCIAGCIARRLCTRYGCRREFVCRVQLSLFRAWDCMAFGCRAPGPVRPDAGRPSPPASSVALIMASPAEAWGEPDKHRLPSRPPGAPQTPTWLGRLAAPAKHSHRVSRNVRGFCGIFPYTGKICLRSQRQSPHAPNLLLQDLPAVRPSR